PIDIDNQPPARLTERMPTTCDQRLIAIGVFIPATIVASIPVIMVLVPVAAIAITAVPRTVWGNYAAAEQHGQTKQDSKAFHDVFQTIQGYRFRRLNP